IKSHHIKKASVDKRAITGLVLTPIATGSFYRVGGEKGCLLVSTSRRLQVWVLTVKSIWKGFV
ncbi:unnamed protein product, partial [Allacma fusca]